MDNRSFANGNGPLPYPKSSWPGLRPVSRWDFTVGRDPE